MLNGKQNSIYFYKKDLLKTEKFLNFEKKVENIKQYNSYLFYARLYLVGIGYKNFVLSDLIYILVGDANYLLFKIPQNVSIFCKKNQVYFLSQDPIALFNFKSIIKKN